VRTNALPLGPGSMLGGIFSPPFVMDSQETPPEAMSLKKARSKMPRLDPKDRLLKRFYDPLVLLHVLDRNGKQSTPRSLDIRDSSDMQLRELRWILLDQLAYVCDNIKGGDTVMNPSPVRNGPRSGPEVAPTERSGWGHFEFSSLVHELASKRHWSCSGD
jgi:hypothetical protein